MHLIEEAFGEGCDLYKDVLNCPRDADAAGLRKAYYRRALEYHPDKVKTQVEEAQLKFQAISVAYQILQDPEARAAYDETGEIADRDEDGVSEQGVDQWKNYFDQIFGKVTLSDIDAFASKYKCSDEERRDVVQEFRKRKGNLKSMMEFVMLSEPRDAQRWVEDYLRPAMEKGGELESLDSSYRETMEKTLKQLQKKVEQENQEAMEEDEETETESEDDLPPVIRLSSKKKAAAAKVSPKKAKPTKAKRKSKDQTGNMSDLIAQIQNKNRGNGLLSSLGARYGVTMDDNDDDPLNDEEFNKIQAQLGKKKGQR